MPDEHVPTREVAGLAPVDPLIAFFWARLDERENSGKPDEHEASCRRTDRG